MINRNHASQLRNCERVKFDQALYILTMYEKKIRRNRQSQINQAFSSPKEETLQQEQVKTQKNNKDSQLHPSIDAQAELQDIKYAWKKKWKLDLTKPILNCVTSVYPRILIDTSNYRERNPSLDRFYTLFRQFVKRLRSEHEDQTNFKFVLCNYNRQTAINEGTEQQNFLLLQKYSPDESRQELKERTKYLCCAKAAVNSLLNIVYSYYHKMVNNFQHNFQFIINQDISEVNTEGVEWQTLRPLRFIREVARRALYGQNSENNMMQQESRGNCSVKIDSEAMQMGSEEAQELMMFVNNTSRLMERIKESEHGSTLITIQPQIKQLTYIVHPLLAAVYGTFKRQNLQKQKQFNWEKNTPVQTDCFLENLKNNYNLSKVVLINLDGYESQINLQLARNFRKNLMYISFPKVDPGSSDFKNVYQKRFLKKLMFNHTQAFHQSYPSEHLSQILKHLNKLDQLNFNPQNYHSFTRQLYSNLKNAGSTLLPQDWGQNIFVFPIRFPLLKDTLSEHFPQTFDREDTELYESYFVRFLLRDFLVNQIREFHPSLVLLSYSGRIKIEDEHFVEIVQNLTKVANYKLLMFNNATTAFCTEDDMQVEDQNGNECEYDNPIQDPAIRSLIPKCQQDEDEKEEQMQEQNVMEPLTSQNIFGIQSNNNQKSTQCSLELFNKVARFLKISSGTYNLSNSRYDEQQQLIAKFKNQFILTYTEELMSALGRQYSTIERIRFKNRDLSIIPKLFEQNLYSIKRSFPKTVPKFYYNLYDVVEFLLFGHLAELGPSRQKLEHSKQLIQQFGCNVSQYTVLAKDLWDFLQTSVSLQNFDGSKRGINLYTLGQDSSSQEISPQERTLLADRNGNQLMSQTLELLKAQKNYERFISLKQLHFLEISSEKYEQRFSMYIKKRPQKKQFSLIQEETEETEGLYDVTFLRKDKIILKIFQTTQVLYRIDQQQRVSSTVPILILNNLSDEKPEYFENYIAELDLKEDQNRQRKDIRQKKVLATPVLFKDGQKTLPSKCFQVMTEWNLAQTTNNLILYWPVRFDFLKATINKLLNRQYHPPVSNDIFISVKDQSKYVFRKVQQILSDSMIAPRTGCSAYQFENRLFIFGGFYGQELNYLNFQHDITEMDLGFAQQQDWKAIKLTNLKNKLYEPREFSQRVNQNRNYNSFIRPRMQFEIFEKGELGQWFREPDPRYRHVILFGGYGQNFLRPYSMITYYYYELTFSYQSHSLDGVTRKIIYDKTVPINTRLMTKNLGIIKTNKKNPNTNILESNKLTEPNSYLSFRNCFSLQLKNGIQDFQYRYKYMFSQDQHGSYKNEIKKAQEQRTEEFDNSSIIVEKIPHSNHLIMLQKDGKKCVISLHLELPHEKSKMLGCSREVKLTHESVIYLDFWNSMVCALVQHPLYTKDKSVLVEYNIKSLENLNFNYDEIPHIALTWLKKFDTPLNKHILVLCNKNTIAILHGYPVINHNLKEFIVKKKKNKSEVQVFELEKRTSSPYQQLGLEDTMKPYSCFSVFFKQRNKIICFQYLAFFEICEVINWSLEIELNASNDVYSWQQTQPRHSNLQGHKSSQIRVLRFVNPQNFKALNFKKLQFLDYILQKQVFEGKSGEKYLQKEKETRGMRHIIVAMADKTLCLIQIPFRKQNEKRFSKEQVEQLKISPITREQIDKLELESAERGIILSKNFEEYYSS